MSCRLFRAVAAGDAALVEALLAEGENIAENDALGRSALLVATMDRNAKIVDPLLANGADPNVSDDWRITPLMRAARVNDVPVVRLLLDAGADPSAEDNDGHTAAWHGLHRDVNLGWGRGRHATLFIRRVFTTMSVRLVRGAARHQSSRRR